MIAIDECRLARIILKQPDRYDATALEIRALNQLVQAFENGNEGEPEMMEIARHLMRSVVDEAEEGSAAQLN